MEVMVRERRLFASGQRNDGKMHAVDPMEVMRHTHVKPQKQEMSWL